MISSLRAPVAITALLLLSSVPATRAPADTPSPADRELSPDTREKIAQLHEQMAACLRSGQSLDECHSQMMKSCEEQLGSDGCRVAVAGHPTDTRHRMRPMGTTPK